MACPSKIPLTIAGPNDRAGFIDAPVSGPIARMSAVTTRPMAKPPTLGAAGSTAVPNTTKMRKNVAITSQRIAWPADSSSGDRLAAEPRRRGDRRPGRRP